MFFYSNIPNRKQYLEQRLAIPAGFRSTVYTPNCQELEHENKPQKLIIFDHQENNLTFAKVNLHQIIYNSRKDMFIFLCDNFLDEANMTSAPIRASIQGIEYNGYLYLDCNTNNGGSLSLWLTQATQSVSTSSASIKPLHVTAMSPIRQVA